MAARYCALFFRHLQTDWFSRRRPALAGTPFVLTASDHGRKIVTAASPAARTLDIYSGMVLADAHIQCPELEVINDIPSLPRRLLKSLALDLIRYTPFTSIDMPDGLLLDISGCPHLWGGEDAYLKSILERLRQAGYHVQGGITDTIGSAWALARYGKNASILSPGRQVEALLTLPPAALRLEPATTDRLFKLGLHRIGQFASMPRSALRRRFGEGLLLRLDQAFGQAEEFLEPVQPPPDFLERLPCLEPIATRTGIEIAIQRLLDTLCTRLQKEGKGLRTAIFKAYRVDGKQQEIGIGTNSATHSAAHLFRLFEEKLASIEPGLGIELFLLEAPKVEDVVQHQQSLWRGNPSPPPNPSPLAARSSQLEASLPSPLAARSSQLEAALIELLDRLSNKFGSHTLHRYLPAESHWPERSMSAAPALTDLPATNWPTDRPRPILILPRPEPITVAAPIPDYPPMHFRYQGILHKIVMADGPERIEDEWWLTTDRIRDYYTVEDETGRRYWLFRSGFYTGIDSSSWFLHGIFA